MRGTYFLTENYDLKNKYAVITGGNSGIGKQTFLELVRLNCNVIIGARDNKKSQEVIKLANQILKNKKKEKNLGSKKSIDSFASFVNTKFPQIDYLVNNAGLSLIPKKKTTEDGFQASYGVNHLGHFYLTFLMMNKLSKSNFFRIINVTSIAHKRVLGFFSKVLIDWQNINFKQQNTYQQDIAYSRSKLYNVLFTKALSMKIPQKKGIALALHPGVVRTDITRHIKLLQYIILIFYPIYWLFTKSSFEGAQTILYTILSNQVKSGQYYSDCKLSPVNPLSLQKQNCQKLWKISQKDLNIKYQISQ